MRPNHRPSQATLRAFAEDPLIDGLWRTYWLQFVESGGDPSALDQARRAFHSSFLPHVMKDPTELAEVFLQAREAEWDGQFQRRAADERAVAQRIEARWGEGLRLLDRMIVLSDELLTLVQRRLQVRGTEPEWTRKALLVVLSRGVQTAWEIRTLLRSGYGSGAWARWRTLHELSVIAAFIGKHGAVVAEPYVLHDEVQTLRIAKAHQKSSATPEVWKEHERAFQARIGPLEARFGKEVFKRDYGWACPAFPSGKFKYPRPSLEDLERSVRLLHARGVVKKADHAIHGGVRGLVDDPAQEGWPPRDLRPSPSERGLDQPAAWTAQSLGGVAASLLLPDAIPSEIMTAAAVVMLRDRILDALQNAGGQEDSTTSAAPDQKETQGPGEEESSNESTV